MSVNEITTLSLEWLWDVLGSLNCILPLITASCSCFHTHLSLEHYLYYAQMRCCYSVAKSCPALCDPIDSSIPVSSFLHYLQEFVQIHVHWVSDAIQPSQPLPPPSSYCLQSFPGSAFFLVSQLFASSGQSTEASASALILPMNI